VTNSARDLLMHNSVEHLLSARYTVEAAFDDDRPARFDPDAGRDLGLALFAAINEILKLTLELDDEETFSKLERKWSRMFDDVWLPGFPREDLAGVWSQRRGHAAGQTQLINLIRQREVLRFGLVMWIGHLLDRPHSPDRAQHLGQAMSQLASRFQNIEWILDAFDAAQLDERGSTPWTVWFLGELPDDDAHAIPTDSKLLWAALLLAARSITPDQPATLRPRDWFVWRREEIAAALDRLQKEREPIQTVLGLTGPFGVYPEDQIPDVEASWTARISRLRELFDAGAKDQRQRETLAVRESKLDPGRVAELRDRTLAESSQARLLRDTVEHHAAVISLPAPPDDHEALVSRVWLPRSYFTADSRLVGLDMLARDLAVPMRNAERQQLASALPDLAPAEHPTETLDTTLRRNISEMRAEGMQPTLMILPLNWQLQREIGLSGFGGTEVRHQLVPVAHPRAFSGVFDEVLALDLVGMPEDLIWILDLHSAIRFEEWPSDNRSGLEFELLSFDDTDAAGAFLQVHPETREPHAPREEAIANLRDQVLVTLRLCWRIRAGDPAATRAVAVPEQLQRDD
jgi:hypothetical protein